MSKKEQIPGASSTKLFTQLNAQLLEEASKKQFPTWAHHIIKKKGQKHQMTVAIEELAELTKVLTKAVRGKPDDMHIAEEIADVEICLTQLKLMFDPTGRKVDTFMQFKIKRLGLFYLEGEHK